MTTIKSTLILSLVLLCYGLSAQNPAEHSVRLLGRATSNSIKLRWAPTTPLAWTYANDYGYVVERTQITEGGKVLDEPVREILTPQPLKPRVMADWEDYIDEDDYVAIAAQAIHGESFDVDEESSGMTRLLNQAQELENRFSFALYAADLSIKAAEMSGLYLEDEEIFVGEKYLYRVYTVIPPEIIKVDTAFVFLGMEDFRPLRPVRDLGVEFHENVAIVSWDGRSVKDEFNTFWLERSEDGGKTFNRTTDVPLVNTFKGDKPSTSRIYKIDSLPSLEKTYYYRVLGVNAFGELGPPSDTIGGRGIPDFRFAPAITGHQITDDGKVELKWQFPQEGVGLLKSFDLLTQDQSSGVYEPIKIGINSEERTVLDEKASSTNYYVIRANDIYERNVTSFPYLVQLEDSIPPVAPSGLVGSIDTLGHVFLEWAPNKEEDVSGYKLYRSNFEDGDFIQVPGPIIRDVHHIDTIHLDNLTETIYYRIVAVDNRFNPSEFSEVLMLKKPDLIPPVPPVFTSISSDSLGVLISWQSSSSMDVVQHLLYRKREDEVDWTLVKIVESKEQQFYLDRNVAGEKAYAYTILAVDDDGLESAPAIPLTVERIRHTSLPAVQEFFYDLDNADRQINLRWQYSTPGVDKFLIYKGINGSSLTLYTAVSGDTMGLTDRYHSETEFVEYSIIASFFSGEKSGFSKKLKVVF